MSVNRFIQRGRSDPASDFITFHSLHYGKDYMKLKLQKFV